MSETSSTPTTKPYTVSGFHSVQSIQSTELVGRAAALKDKGYYLETLTPVELDNHFEIVYLFNNFEKTDRQKFIVELSVDDESAPTLTGVFAAANWLEREAFDMFGIKFPGHPDLKRILLPEGANFHPLRRAYKFEGDSLEDLERETAYEKEKDSQLQETVVGKNVKEYFINMGPQHPSTHGVLRLLLHMNGERVLTCEPVVGYAHRADEKIGMLRSWQQFYPYPPRVDYLGAMMYNWGYVGTVEKALEIEVPERAEYIRLLACELNRLASHLLWLGTFLLDLGSFTPFLYCMDEREKILDILERVTGERLTYIYFRFGGVARDVDDQFLTEIKEFIKEFPKKLKDYHKLITGNVIFMNRTQGLGIISPEMARSYGVTGANLRATGINYDVRKNEPYGLYPQFDFDIPTDTAGDSFARYTVRMREMEQSVRILEQAVDQFPREGEYLSAKVPKKGIKVPEGENYFAVEGARGEFGCYIVSTGKEIPRRIKLRTPCFANLSAFSEMVNGHDYQISDIAAILGSLDIVVPDVDR
jgi:NADH-quinone oxidoreductase subunit D